MFVLPLRLVFLTCLCSLSTSLWAQQVANTPTVKGRAPVAAPTLESIAPVVVGSTVTATSGFSDEDGDAEQGTTWRWLLNGVAIGGAESNSYTLLPGDGNGKALQVEALVATDPTSTDPAQSDPALSTVITTQGSAPVATLSPLANSVYQYDLVTSGGYAYSDADGDLESGSTFDWLLDDLSILIGGSAIAHGSNKQSRQLMPADVGKLLTFSVTPRSATGEPSVGDAAKVMQTVVVPAGLQVINFSKPDGLPRNWSGADSYCKYTVGNGARLPTKDELLELFVNATRSMEGVVVMNTDMCNLHGWCGAPSTYWSSDSRHGVSLSNGDSNYVESYSTFQVACVL
ncbi:hypothetical protein BLL42_28275 (plasmid) [Pseudomonas frederiksbergensis]|uniref:DUF1554 domain-containing protein n=1 Tax=Pseudomonas frederiksbergensis TaxID=104087 RepID=A0A1J0ETZ0_9PSED|nr:hypothetical protein [Pseudomonas frederiksbergensis]APC19610.1 hypothetical protein BLL42_28275 [Pseudomonas frederiksbergensis]